MAEQEQEFNPDTHDMLLVYTDDDGKVHEFDGDVTTLTFKQLWDIQKVTGLNGLGPIGEALTEMNAPTLMALLWVYRREEEPEVKFADMNSVRLNQVEFRPVPKAEADPKASAPTDAPFSTSADETTSTHSSPSSDTTSESDPAISPI